ncbi:lipopolysaccharide heptosyltransferase II [Denitratisoma oestradiolicum]|uniref:lipopolysaccharide heptosyltransferase II n=1 Tax=Denitratisoma oestradiolicum TaxID=311182 RepID=A0A6S6YQL8_9PROT|nr:lipopolysaccharide heptosyltransferase II [Denitratisoma oestradiolicum]TWO80093.1 lipopolysaccharide heptosyltransferase II [Denitratisoma oestradiolicum]CAB1370072.1 ADP-heptose--LPS heptosyltransferase 2 [Denitratisoma oestradiolicum]
MGSPTRILVVAPSWIGDTLIAQPLLARLAARGASIDVLAPDWCAPLLERMPEVRRVIGSPFRHGDFAFWARRALGRALAQEGYDEAVVLPNSWKSALVPFFARIPKRTGFTGEARIGLLNNRHVLDKVARSQLAQRYAQLAEAPGSDPLLPLPQPRLCSTPEQQAAARRTLGLPLDAAPVILCPGAEYGPAKRWPVRHFADLARRLAQDGLPVWLLGAAKDAAVGDEIAALAEGMALNLCGRTSLTQAIDLLAGARQVVSNDSGLMHVAAALDRPLVALYGSSSPAYTPPMSSRARIISLKLSCSPCFQRECPLGHLKCLEDLMPEQVIETLNNVFHAHP